MTDSRTCIYCDEQKPAEEFSLEHIWPDALGGDHLPEFWRTDDVCRRCNNISGLFVDGAFIKSFAISGERANDALSYLPPDRPTGAIPLSYLGTVQNVTTADDEVVDFWVCAPGANILHIRKKGEPKIWDAYAGGDPKLASKRSKAGRVVVSFTSAEPYWIATCLRSILKHFPKAARFVTNLELPENPKNFKKLDPADPQLAADLRLVREFQGLREQGEWVHAQVAIVMHADGRFLAKLALAVGYQLFGNDFLATPYAAELRKGFFEADPSKRAELRIRGTSYLRGIDLGPITDTLRWPGGWQLSILRLADALALIVTAPTGRAMGVRITDDAALLARLDPGYRDGRCWVVVPVAQKVIGPLPYPEYLAHVMGYGAHPELSALEALRGDLSRLPNTGLKDAA